MEETIMEVATLRECLPYYVIFTAIHNNILEGFGNANMVSGRQMTQILREVYKQWKQSKDPASVLSQLFTTTISTQSLSEQPSLRLIQEQILKYKKHLPSVPMTPDQFLTSLCQKLYKTDPHQLFISLNPTETQGRTYTLHRQKAKYKSEPGYQLYQISLQSKWEISQKISISIQQPFHQTNNPQLNWWNPCLSFAFLFNGPTFEQAFLSENFSTASKLQFSILVEESKYILYVVIGNKSIKTPSLLTIRGGNLDQLQIRITEDKLNKMQLHQIMEAALPNINYDILGDNLQQRFEKQSLGNHFGRRMKITAVQKFSLIQLTVQFEDQKQQPFTYDQMSSLVRKYYPHLSLVEIYRYADLAPRMKYEYLLMYAGTDCTGISLQCNSKEQ